MSRVDLTTLKPRDLEAHFRELIRLTFNDKVENKATIYASSGGNYCVAFEVGKDAYDFTFKKKSANRIASAIRALK